MKFELIRGPTALEGTCYFELVKDSHRSSPCWNENAVYLKDSTFNYFVRVFSDSCENFDYFSFCCFDQSEVRRLRNNLESFEAELNSVQDIRELLPFLSNEFIRIRIQDPEINLATNLKRLTREMKLFVEECVTESEALWVLGM